ncbi:TlpA family protein disulfide reductase [Sphingobacterium bovistauri]|uniref:Redoxin domain-containing protein n=1 Tax=Sphingobacterium bovistauri TaxID=2781959 RepID=A0ABS7Z7U1_9SPHI|nr:hypothetical protein [Sphingobacterium bovistauri]MCA5005657.1 redoxin domain-containing protein [Sphingobacterium bovistauri]
MKNFYWAGSEMPQGQSYARLIIQNKITPKTNLLPSEHEESEGEELTSDEKNSYASYLASIIYDYQLKYVSIFLLTFLSMLKFDFAYAQETTKSEIVPLQIGQKVPEEFWTKEHLFYINCDTVRKSLEEHKGKMVVLDFWMTGCMPCLLHQKEINRFKEKYPDELYIVMINSLKTKENYKKIHSFASSDRYKSLNLGMLNSIIEDNYLQMMFPYRSYPSYFWINESGILQTHTYRNLLDPNYQPPFILNK